MNLKRAFPVFLPGLLLLAGCTHNSSTSRSHMAYVNPYATRRMITGSNVPQPVNRPTFSPTSSTALPVDSFANERGSLVPYEPVVGAGTQSLYRLNEPSNGASPAGSAPDPGVR